MNGQSRCSRFRNPQSPLQCLSVPMTSKVQMCTTSIFAGREKRNERKYCDLDSFELSEVLSFESIFNFQEY
jgi:hypothetical protein